MKLDLILQSLANKHRREIIIALGLQPHSITQLAKLRKLSLPAIHKHIKLLEKGGIIIRKKIGRVNFLTLNRESLKELQVWLNQFQTHWGNNLESLENYTQHLSKK
jgi:DNA-binding transcriptional ArsR family regulator